MLQTGKLDYLERLKKEVPTGLIDLLGIPGLGPKKVAAMYKNLGITSIQELREAAQNGDLRALEGFGEITERNILRGIQLREKTSGRVLLNVAYEDSQRYLDYMKKCTKITKIDIAGSLRRMKETIGDSTSLFPQKTLKRSWNISSSTPRSHSLGQGTTNQAYC